MEICLVEILLDHMFQERIEFLFLLSEKMCPEIVCFARIEKLT